MRKTIRYKKGDIVRRKITESTTMRGWQVVEESTAGGFNVGKGVLLGILFLPLALFGFTGSKYIDVTYEKI